MVDVRFENLRDKAEGDYLAQLPTSFRLPSEDVDRLRAAARFLLRESEDFQKLIKDLSGQP
jgi:NTE family protein